MIVVEVDRLVPGSPTDVFDFVADHANNPTWQSGMKSCTWTSPPPVAVGSTYDQVAHFLGREIQTSFEVVAFEPGSSITIESRSGPLDLRITRSVDADGPGARTRLRARIEGTPRGLMRLAGPLMAGKVRRDIGADYDRLEILLADRFGDGD